jgi:hypothetical protein
MNEPLLGINYSLRARFCNASFSREPDSALIGRPTACLRSDPGFYCGVVDTVQMAPYPCPLQPTHVHLLRVAVLRVAGGRTKTVPVNILGTWPHDAAPVSEAERMLASAVTTARFNGNSVFHLHELVVVPLRGGGFSFALVVCCAELCLYPCYLHEGESHMQPIVAVSLLDERGGFKRRRKRLPVLLVGKLPAHFQSSDVWLAANRAVARMNKNQPPVAMRPPMAGQKRPFQ